MKSILPNCRCAHWPAVRGSDGPWDFEPLLVEPFWSQAMFAVIATPSRPSFELSIDSVLIRLRRVLCSDSIGVAIMVLAVARRA